MERPLVASWLKFPSGVKHSFMDCEALALTKIDPSVIAAHWEATDTAWFDYVRVHPVMALYHFCWTYSRQYGRYLEQNINMELAYSRGLKGDPLDSREQKQLLSLKLMADQKGIPYDAWIRGLFSYYASNGWTRPPRPSHMASNLEAQEYAEQKWLEWVTEVSTYAQDPWFSVENWTGHTQQKRYEDWLVSCVGLREDKKYILCHLVYERGQLRLERALQEFGESLVLSALKVSQQ